MASAPDGTQFLVEVDDAVRAALRQAALRTSSLHEPTLQTGALRKVPVRDIQAHIRGGLTAEQVAEITGFPVYDIRRYEGPILAEREHVLTSALAIPVQLPAGGLDAPVARFGAVIARRLEQLAVRGQRWASWKDVKDGWMVKLTFTADGVDHDARWSFDLKKSVLAPLNSEATALSQQHEATGTLMPRLRALPADEAPVDPDASRFDSAIFDLTPRDPASRPTTEAPRLTQRDAPAAGTPIVGTSIVGTPIVSTDAAAASGTSTPGAARSARDVDTTEVLPGRGAERGAERGDLRGHPRGGERPSERSGPTRRVEPRAGSIAGSIGGGGRDPLPPDLGETADLLDALRRRRSEREAASKASGVGSGSAFRRPESDLEERSTGATVKMFERPTPNATAPLPPPPRQLPNSGKGPRRGRANLPSWDEIVFGARPDDEDGA